MTFNSKKLNILSQRVELIFCLNRELKKAIAPLKHLRLFFCFSSSTQVYLVKVLKLPKIFKSLLPPLRPFTDYCPPPQAY